MTAHLDELADIARGAVRNAEVEVAVAGRFGLLFRPNDKKALHSLADPRQAVAARQASAAA